MTAPARSLKASLPFLLVAAPWAGAEDLEAVRGQRLSIHLDRESVRVLAGESLVARYRHGGAIRKPYLAELSLPGGPNILLDSPPDHPHHHGLMFACVADGVNFWEEGEKGGREAHLAFAALRVETRRGAEAAVLVEKLRWEDASGLPILDEERSLTVFEPARPEAQLLLWESRLSPAAGRPSVTLSASPYHGLGLRFARSMDRGGRFFSSGGGEGVSGTNEKEASWCAYSAEAAPGWPVTLALLDGPANPRHPSRWFTMDDPFAYLSATQAIGARPVTVCPGDAFVLAVGVALFRERAAATRLERAYRYLFPAEAGGED
jgi:hypothetical protein